MEYSSLLKKLGDGSRFEPLNCLCLCSKASNMLLFPKPFGPTSAIIFFGLCPRLIVKSSKRLKCFKRTVLIFIVYCLLFNDLVCYSIRIVSCFSFYVYLYSLSQSLFQSRCLR